MTPLGQEDPPGHLSVGETGSVTASSLLGEEKGKSVAKIRGKVNAHDRKRREDGIRVSKKRATSSD